MTLTNCLLEKTKDHVFACQHSQKAIKLEILKKDELGVLTRFYATEVAGKSRVCPPGRSPRILDLTDDARKRKVELQCTT